MSTVGSRINNKKRKILIRFDACSRGEESRTTDKQFESREKRFRILEEQSCRCSFTKLFVHARVRAATNKVDSSLDSRTSRRNPRRVRDRGRTLSFILISNQTVSTDSRFSRVAHFLSLESNVSFNARMSMSLSHVSLFFRSPFENSVRRLSLRISRK